MKNYHYNPGWETKSWAFIFKGLAYELTKEGEKIRWASVKTCVDSDTEKFLNRHGVEKPEEEMVRLVMEIRQYLLESIPSNFAIIVQRNWLNNNFTWEEVGSIEEAKEIFNYQSVFLAEIVDDDSKATVKDVEFYKEGDVGYLSRLGVNRNKVKVIKILHRNENI